MYDAVNRRLMSPKVRGDAMLKPDPIGEARNPLAVYLLLLALISGVGLLLGTPTAGSIEATLPVWASKTWGGFLTVGGGCVLAGMYWPGDPRTGLVVKRFGFLALIVASSIYALVLLLAIGINAFLVAGIVLGFGVACTLQYLRVNRRIMKIRKRSA